MSSKRAPLTTGALPSAQKYMRRVSTSRELKTQQKDSEADDTLATHTTSGPGSILHPSTRRLQVTEHRLVRSRLPQEEEIVRLVAKASSTSAYENIHSSQCLNNWVRLRVFDCLAVFFVCEELARPYTQDDEISLLNRNAGARSTLPFLALPLVHVESRGTDRVLFLGYSETDRDWAFSIPDSHRVLGRRHRNARLQMHEVRVSQRHQPVQGMSGRTRNGQSHVCMLKESEIAVLPDGVLCAENGGRALHRQPASQTPHKHLEHARPSCITPLQLSCASLLGPSCRVTCDCTLVGGVQRSSRLR